MQKYVPEGCLYETPENISYLRDLRGLFRAWETGATLEARAVICDSAHNLYVDLNGVRGFIPREDAALGIRDGSVRDVAILSRVNKPVCFRIVNLVKSSEGNYEAILSRRLAQEDCLRTFVKRLCPGDIIDARVTHLDSFGAFVDIGCGIPALIPIDAISVSRISHPADRFVPGQSIKAIVRDVDMLSRRITLSHKELLGTWEENAAAFSPGDTVAGIVRSIESYGIFVELTPNLAGLAELKEGVCVGQQASVYIKNILPEKMKVKLIIVESFDTAFSPPPMRYFIQSGTQKTWVYSPEVCRKVIESVF